MQVSLDDEVRNLAFRLATFLPIHIRQQIEGANEEVAAPTCWIHKRDVAEWPYRPVKPWLALRRSDEIRPALRQRALRVHLQPERTQSVLEQIVHHVPFGVQTG